MRERLRKLRKENGLSQAEMAKKLNVHQTAVSQWEQGRTTPDMQTLIKISQLFSVSTDYLLGETEQKGATAQGNDFVLNEHEKDLISAYRRKTAMQPAVDRLLEVQQGESDGSAAYIAAHGKDSKGGATIHLSADELEKLNKAPETDEDF